MKILLLGDYSNVHATLAGALRHLGHQVTLASDGDGWKNYPRDIDLSRRMGGFVSKIRYWNRLRTVFKTFRDYDVVQCINPVFLPLRGERIKPYYDYLRRYNKRIYLCAFGMDYYYAKAALAPDVFRYSDFHTALVPKDSPELDIWRRDWLEGPKGEINRYIANDCDGIISGLYEYHAAYAAEFAHKETFIPFPIDTEVARPEPNNGRPHDKLRFFIGIQRGRSVYKGTDVMLRALEKVVALFPDECEMVKVESVPFAEYRRLLGESDVILDQLYSYTPAMNALEAMSRGMVVVGGGEPENYAVLHETELRPIINVQPNERSVFEALCRLVRHRDRIPNLAAESREYILRHHEMHKVAKRYLEVWQR